jgi:peptide/nickel transport system ATP-binding protein
VENEILIVQNLKKYFPIKGTKKQFVKAVDNVSFSLKNGEVLGLVGESGSGKSTIAYNIMGMHRITDGRRH